MDAGKAPAVAYNSRMFDPSGPMGAANPQELMIQLMNADEAGVKLEVVQGEFVWEFFPSPLHQGLVRDLDRSVRPTLGDDHGCGCFTLADAYLQFRDGSLKRPDLMLFCERPVLTREPLTIMPEAIVEILSPRGERKDLQVGPPFYLSHGIKDVLVVDPERRQAHHFRHDGYQPVALGVTVRLECGCELTVPHIP